MSKLHVVPIGDLVYHRTEVDEDCICGPTTEPVEKEDGSYGWLFIHHSLDGRESTERKEQKEEAEDLGRGWLTEDD